MQVFGLFYSIGLAFAASDSEPRQFVKIPYFPVSSCFLKSWLIKKIAFFDPKNPLKKCHFLRFSPIFTENGENMWFLAHLPFRFSRIFFSSLVVQLIWKLMMLELCPHVENCALESVGDILSFKLAQRGVNFYTFKTAHTNLVFSFFRSNLVHEPEIGRLDSL